MPKTPRDGQFLGKLGERISQCEDAAWHFSLQGYSLAGELGVTNATMSRYRLGRSEPPIEKLKKIAEKACVNFQWLATGEGERDRPNDQEIALDKRAFLPVRILDQAGAILPDAIWGYIARSCCTNLPCALHVPPPEAIVGQPHLACFQITESLHGQKYPRGTWALVDLKAHTPTPGWFCLKGASDEACVREIDLDDDGTIELVWPRTARLGDVKKYNSATFLARFTVIGRVLGSMFGP
jgi:transcriptional regulator with XRE-family HTH domain